LINLLPRVFSAKWARSGKGERRMLLARAAKPLKRLKTTMGSYWKKLAWIWVWRHVGLGLALCSLGVGAASAGIDGTMPAVNAIRASGFAYAFATVTLHNTEGVHADSRRGPDDPRIGDGHDANPPAGRSDAVFLDGLCAGLARLG
jgi:hypothetical protein